MNELVSVIIPLYNRRAFIGQALESIAKQTYRPLEVVVVDDGSSDDSAQQALRHIETHDLRGQVLSIANSGPDAARDFGMLRTQGGLIAFLDSDDYYLPDYLERMVHALNGCGQGWAFSDFYLTDADLNPAERKSQQLKLLFSLAQEAGNGGFVLDPGVLFSYLLREQPIFPSAMMMRRTTYDHMGPFTKLISQRILSLEWEFMLRCAKVAPVVYVPDPLVKIRKHEGNISGMLVRQDQGEIAVLKTVLERYDLSPEEELLVRREIARRCWDVGYFYYSRDDLKTSRSWFLDSCRHKILPKNVPYLAVSLLPAALNKVARSCKKVFG